MMSRAALAVVALALCCAQLAAATGCYSPDWTCQGGECAAAAAALPPPPADRAAAASCVPHSLRSGASCAFPCKPWTPHPLFRSSADNYCYGKALYKCPYGCKCLGNPLACSGRVYPCPGPIRHGGRCPGVPRYGCVSPFVSRLPAACHARVC